MHDMVEREKGSAMFIEEKELEVQGLNQLNGQLEAKVGALNGQVSDLGFQLQGLRDELTNGQAESSQLVTIQTQL